MTMDTLVLQAVDEIALEGPEGCTATRLWTLLSNGLPKEVKELTNPLRKLVLAELQARPDISVKYAAAHTAERSGCQADGADASKASATDSAEEDGITLLATTEARDMALGLYERDPVHPLNADMRKTLELTGKSRDKGAVQPDVARICNVPHKNFFIVVKTLEIHNLVIRSDIQVRNSKGTMGKTNILHLPRFAPKLAPGLQFAKEVSDDQLYAVTDDDATIAYLLKRMREMDPDGVGIVRSEFKRFVLSRMHSGSLKQNHRLWRRLQTRMQKQGVLELDVHVVQGSDRTTIKAAKPNASEENDNDPSSSWDLGAEHSFAREFFHIVMNAGEEGIVMSELGKHLQFPIRTFHKPNFLQDFTSRLGLYACKEQKGKSVVVCLRAPPELLAEYRQSNAPTGPWLAQGWLSAVCDAMDPELTADAEHSEVPLITATPADILPAGQVAGNQQSQQQQQQQDQYADQSQGQQQTEQKDEPSLAATHSKDAVDAMPLIPEAGSAVVEGDQAEADRERNQSEQAQAEIRGKVEAELLTMQPWINDQSRIAYDRIRRLLEHLEDAGFLFKSALRRYLKDTDPSEIPGNGPDSKTIERYLEALCRHGKAQKLVIPVTLASSTVVTKDMLAYVKPGVQVNDALIEQLVAKWRAISSAHRKEGVQQFYQGIRQKPAKQEQTQDAKPPPKPVRPGKAPSNMLKAGQEFVNRLYDNGYIRPKMIRIRLLHYWICRLIGLGGYERLAEADQQLQQARPKEHVFMFRAAMPDSDRIKTTAQLTSGADSWSSPNSFTAQQLWEWMPVDIYLQTFGTTNTIPKLAELTSSGKRMRELSEAQLLDLMDNNADRRTKQHIEILRCLGLVESVVTPHNDGDRPEPLAPTVASRYVALTKGIVEVKKSEGSPEATGNNGSDEYVQRSFDLSTHEGLEGYWAQLAQMSVDYSKPNQGAASRAWKAPSWFPSTTVSDILNRRAWNTLHVMTLEQSHALKQAFAQAADQHGYVSWLQCMHIAKELNLEYEQVNTLSNIRKARLGRLDPVFKVTSKALLRPRAFNILPPEVVAEHEAKSRVSIAQRLTAQGVSGHILSQMVEEQIEKNRRVRERQLRKKQGLSPRRKRRHASEIPDDDRSYRVRNEKRKAEKASRVDDGELGPGFVPRRPSKVKRRADSDAEDSEAAGQKRPKKGPAYRYTVEDDTVILRSFARWRTHRSPEYYVNFRRFKLPVSLESAKRRCYKALARYSETQAHMETLKELCVDVYHRHHARKLAAWQAKQAVASTGTGQSTVALASRPATRPQTPAAVPAAVPAAAEAANASKAALPIDPAGKRKYKRTEYLSSDRLASVMDTFMTAASSRSVSPNDDAPAPQLLQNQPTSAQPQEGSTAQPQVGNSSAEAPRSPNASAQGIAKAGTPVGSPLSPSRALLDPYEPLFDVEDEEDERALEEIEGMIQLILDVTPRRTESRRKPSQLEGLEDDIYPTHRRKRHRSADADQLDAAQGDIAASLVKGRGISRMWRKTVPLPARGPLQMPGALKPTVVEAHAMELIKSMLYLADAFGLAEHDVVAAVSRRFTSQEITAALAFLQQQGLVNASGVKRPLMLSRLFAEHMEALDMPQTVLTEAVEARQRLAGLLHPTPTDRQGSGQLAQADVATVAIAGDEQVTGGMVCEVLTLMAAGKLQLRPGQVKVEVSMLPPLDPSSSTALSGATGPVQVDIPITICPPANPVEHTYDPNPSLDPTSDMQLGSDKPEGHLDLQNPQETELDASAAACNGASQKHVQQKPSEPGPEVDAPINNGASQKHAQQQPQQQGSQQQGQQQQIKSRKGKRKGRPTAQAEALPGPAEANGAAADENSVDAKQARPDVEAIMAKMQRHVIEAGASGLTQTQLTDKLQHSPERGTHDKLASLALTQLLAQKQTIWAPAFDQNVLIATALTDRLTAGYKGSVVEDNTPAQDFQSLAGLQAQTSGKGSARHSHVQDSAQNGSTNPLKASHVQHTDQSGSANPLRTSRIQDIDQNGSTVPLPALASSSGQAVDAEDICRVQVTARKGSANPMSAVGSTSGNAVVTEEGACLLHPWLDDRGQLNQPFWTALTQRALSVVMRNPGIPAELLISQLQALTPQQARALVELMAGQNILQVQSVSKAPEAAVPSIFGSRTPLPMQVAKHYFVAPGAGFGALSD